MSDDNDDRYQAISCADYSRYEEWIMHGQRLQIAWRDAQGQDYIGLLQPLDLQSRRRQEFLIAQPVSGGDTVHIRLDRILRCNPDKT
ncbi:hypothetical protein [Thiohalophilus sp.]|uniref:hypothetical protein n=1 Tax=Thiohalophilus sp. TaxID=3028392 RepID=UPI002ACE2678|nr:hypothetical protein [Thiohalophilus sp.]MDZ7803657.1 hypothetical protein [Thiohalophilus sp.]